jgi:hypothetical protein
VSVAGHKVVAFTPWGRELTASILYKYLKRDHERGVLDEWYLCMNTDQEQYRDREYGYELARDNDWITVKEIPEGKQYFYPKQQNTRHFYDYMTDPETVYIRFDDDIVYVEDNAIENLATARVKKPQPFVIFPIIWNNAICSYYLQSMGIVGREHGIVEVAHCMEATGWRSPEFAVYMHETLLAAIEQGTVYKLFMHHDIQLEKSLQFSVSCFAKTGYADEVPIESEEESWHTIEQPGATGRANMILSNALVSHFSFYHQREFLLEHTDLLDRYRALADAL